MPVFAGKSALAPLDFRGLGGENTRYLGDKRVRVSVPRGRTEASRLTPIASAQCDRAHAPRRADLRRLSGDRAARAVVEQH